MVSYAWVEQLIACGLKEIGTQLEFTGLIKENMAPQQNMKVFDTCTEVLTSSDSRSIRSVETVKPARNALKTMSDLACKIYKAK